ncbi:MAG: HDOD domain-containing protein [Anaeromyxobacter sp.]|nr:HDOD domain-containing protein [Anaeromyxobacter sp.]MBL0276678.1 HDOD domain-containing protein [Anaeromyxobacter sp.]
MIHAFRLGPVSSSPTPSFAFAAVRPNGTLELRFAPGEPQGLAALREAVDGQPLSCEPPLAEAAGPLGLSVAPLPPEVLRARAQLAYELASGIDHGASRPEAIGALLTAAGAFWASKAWELIDTEEQLHVAFTWGRSLVQGEVSVQASDRTQPRLVLCDEPAALSRLAGLSGPERVAELIRGAGLTVELTREPAWAGAAIEEAFRLPRVPLPERRRAGRIAPVATQDLLTAAALLQCVVAYADLGDGSQAEAVVEAATLRVRARIGPTPPDPGALQAAQSGSGLTPVEPGDERNHGLLEGEALPAPAAAAAPPTEPEPAAPAAAEDDDRPLTPEELAAIVKGGTAAAAPEPAPAAPAAVEDDDRPLTPEELAAIVKGGTAAAAPEPEPAAPAAAVDDDKPLTPEELAALMKGAAAPPATVAVPAAAAPVEVEAAPAQPAAPSVEPAPPSAAAPEPVPVVQAEPKPAPEAAPPAPSDRPAPAEGWLNRTWRALGASLQRAPAASEPGAAPAPPPKVVAKTAPPKPPKPAAPARRAPPPPAVPEAPPDPAVPFSAFARALKVAVPLEPLPAPLAEREAASALATQLATDATGREHFVSFPAVALQIIEQVHSPTADARGVAGFISRDPGLAADVLAVANSAAFRGVSEAGSVREAVARLGLQEVGRVASAVSARALLLTAQPGGGAPSTRLFTRAVAVATAASATALRLRGAHSDQVWLAGLLHDVGLALGRSALHRLGAAGGAAVTGPVAERAVEQAHVEIGAAALRAWGLPGYLSDVCARHHDEELPAGPELVDLHLVRLTSALARLDEPEVGARAAREVMSSARALGFDVHAVRALAADLKAAEQRAAVLVR